MAIPLAAFFYILTAEVSYYAYCQKIPDNVVDVWSKKWLPGILARLLLSVELIVAAAGRFPNCTFSA